MITSLISAIIGLFSGLAPDLLKEFSAGRAQKREIDFMRLQNELALKRAAIESEDKMRESHDAMLSAEIAATRDQLMEVIKVQAAPTGVPWIDGFNALLRPTATLFILILFMATSVLYVQGVVHAFNAGKLKDTVELANVIWGSMLGESVQAVIGFLFGYRSVRK